MQADPFGNLRDWGPVLEQVCQMADKGNLSECQPGLIRILRYRDNWRLREETLKRIGKIDNPEDALVSQVLNIIADENLYYEVRVLACETMEELMNNASGTFEVGTGIAILETVDLLLSTTQPPIFFQALNKLYPATLEKFEYHRGMLVSNRLYVNGKEPRKSKIPVS